MLITKIEIENFLGIKFFKQQITSKTVMINNAFCNIEEREDVFRAFKFIYNQLKIPTLELIEKRNYPRKERNEIKLLVRIEYTKSKKEHSLCKEIIYKRGTDKVQATTYYYIDDEKVNFVKYNDKINLLYLFTYKGMNFFDDSTKISNKLSIIDFNGQEYLEYKGLKIPTANFDEHLEKLKISFFEVKARLRFINKKIEITDMNNKILLFKKNDFMNMYSEYIKEFLTFMAINVVSNGRIPIFISSENLTTFDSENLFGNVFPKTNRQVFFVDYLTPEGKDA